ncbi:hypothetical protein DPMN_171391 [Dreissena polymorpha]|uniref:Uncharacterized protein n=1 Tax=Dreissena polymorpha TaxID=45954 RepID=A0A9D4E091_DREPO|nr:hypothetical protein DPMN_171391 [Dreissena polymorpha]
MITPAVFGPKKFTSVANTAEYLKANREVRKKMTDVRKKMKDVRKKMKDAKEGWIEEQCGAMYQHRD